MATLKAMMTCHPWTICVSDAFIVWDRQNADFAICLTWKHLSMTCLRSMMPLWTLSVEIILVM